MNQGLSDQVRKLAKREFIERALSKERIEVSLGDVQRALRKQGFPSNHLRQIRTALESSLFWESAGLKLISTAGQPDRVSTVLVFGFVGNTPANSGNSNRHEVDPLLELSGVLRGAIREGAAAFLKELRTDKDMPSLDHEKENAA